PAGLGGGGVDQAVPAPGPEAAAPPVPRPGPRAALARHAPAGAAHQRRRHVASAHAGHRPRVSRALRSVVVASWVEAVGRGPYGGCMRPVTDLERRVAPFSVVSDFAPSGDQPQAIDELEQRIRAEERDVVLLGA